MFCLLYNPKSNRETLAEFNARVDETCADNPIVKITFSCVGSALLLSLTSADDIDVIDQPTVTATIRSVDTSDKSKRGDLEEEVVDLLIAGEADKSTDDNPRVPVEATLVPRMDDPNKGYLALLMINGMAEDDSGDDGEEGDDEGDEPPGDGEALIPVRTAEVMPR